MLHKKTYESRKFNYRLGFRSSPFDWPCLILDAIFSTNILMIGKIMMFIKLFSSSRYPFVIYILVLLIFSSVVSLISPLVVSLYCYFHFLLVDLFWLSVISCSLSSRSKMHCLVSCHYFRIIIIHLAFNKNFFCQRQSLFLYLTASKSL